MFIEFRIIFIRIIFVRYHRVEFWYGMGLFRDLQWDGLFVDDDGHHLRTMALVLRTMALVL